MENQHQFFTVFKQYSSLQQHTNTKFINRVTKSEAISPKVLWVATEKIHGANFSIVIDLQKDLVKYGRRTDFITDQIPIPIGDVTPFFKQNFNDANQLVNKFHNSLIKVKENIRKKYPQVIGAQIFGQYFGGYWPGKVQCKRKVQLGVYYTPNHEFMVFDIRLYGQNFHTWVQVTEIPQIVQNYLKYVPIYGKGTYEQIQTINSEFDSTIPQLLGFQKLQNNICQGLILRPNKNFHLNNRVVIKKKNKEFLQKAGFAKKGIEQKKQKQEDKNQKVQILKNYLNGNRIESAISKYPDFEDQYHLKGYVISDIMTDAKKDGYEEPQQPKRVQKIKKIFDRYVLLEIIGYLQTQRKQFIDRIKK